MRCPVSYPTRVWALKQCLAEPGKLERIMMLQQMRLKRV